MKALIPKEVGVVADTLRKARFEAYIVGGCIRDLLMDRSPNDWDIATDAKPEEVARFHYSSDLRFLRQL